ncbi:MAG: hypothetical protein LV479_09940 [Methylacidiphilales bacterium]|nr:hypothetical protein [Candidatus Methylacidiphilales bacterium]
MAGLGMEGSLLSAFMFLTGSSQPVHVPLNLLLGGVVGMVISIFWRQVGVDYFNYLLYDSPKFMGGDEDEDAPSFILQALIRDVEESEGFARNEARARAKTWLLDHVSLLNEEEIHLAEAHFGYMLPAGWGHPSER